MQIELRVGWQRLQRFALYLDGGLYCDFWSGIGRSVSYARNCQSDYDCQAASSHNRKYDNFFLIDQGFCPLEPKTPNVDSRLNRPQALRIALTSIRG